MDPREYEERIAETNAEFYRRLLENELKRLKRNGGEKYNVVIENCKKLIIMDRNIGKILRKFFDELELNDYLQETKPLRMMAGVMYRNTLTLGVIENIGNPYLPKEYSPFKELLKQKGLDEHYFTVLYVTLVIHLWFDQTEFFKNMILTILNKKARKECSITNSDTLGMLFEKLGKKILVDEFKSIIKPEFRNAIGHSKWWIQKDTICYQDKNDKIIAIHKLEFVLYYIQLVTLTLEFIAVLHEYYLMP